MGRDDVQPPDPVGVAAAVDLVPHAHDETPKATGANATATVSGIAMNRARTASSYKITGLKTMRRTPEQSGLRQWQAMKRISVPPPASRSGTLAHRNATLPISAAPTPPMATNPAA